MRAGRRVGGWQAGVAEALEFWPPFYKRIVCVCVCVCVYIYIYCWTRGCASEQASRKTVFRMLGVLKRA